MLLVLYSFILSYMLFFTLCVAPLSNKILDENSKSLFLRRIFPQNFIFGFIISFFVIIISFLENNYLSFIIGVLINIGFFLNLFVIMPKINKAKDSIRLKKTHNNKSFKYWHFVSVIIYLIQMIITSIIIYSII